MKKLIRDNIPEIALKEGRVLDTYIEHDDVEYLSLLQLKLMEEAAEVFQASRQGDLLEELADVIAVLEAIVRHLDCEDMLYEVANKKFNEKGGFSKRIVLTK